VVAYSFKTRFYAPIKVGLGAPIEPILGLAIPCGLPILPKRQTIRPVGKRRHARPGETLQLYTGMRTKQCKSIGVAKCTEVHPIEIRFDDVVFWVILPASSTRAARIKGDKLEEFARADGFADSADMAAFWRAEHGSGIFKGVLIRWEPIR
jgi:hypothetical protein